MVHCNMLRATDEMYERREEARNAAHSNGAQHCGGVAVVEGTPVSAQQSTVHEAEN
eukprot:SAG22_NODE_640_length_8247_cov_3.832351_4_plen_56_part_00